MTRSGCTEIDPHSCRHCNIIFINSPPSGFVLTSWGSSLTVRLPHTREEAFQACANGCPLFEGIFEWLATEGSPMRCLLKGIFWGRYNSTSTKKGLRRRISHVAHQRDRRPFHIRLDYFRGSAKISFVYRKWEKKCLGAIHANEDDPTARYILTRPLNRNPASEKAFRLANQWLQQCHTLHDPKVCPRMQHDFTPTRLLDVGTSDTQLFVKLHEVTAGQTLKWCSLSYCWGGPQQLQLTKTTLEKWKTEIPWESSSKTLQDAVIITRRLNLRYLWVDCLCIVQDDPEDVEKELSCMAKIYKYAYVTLSASSAKESREGFLHSRAGYFGNLAPFRLRCRWSDGTVGSLTVCEELIHRQADPIDHRAWTFQERILSPRVLDYTCDNLLWTCRSRLYSDGGHPGSAQLFKDRDEDQTRAYPPLLAAYHPKLFKSWDTLVVDYTRRQLTFPNDKLVAISAVAEEIASLCNSKYLAGLWEKSFSEGLGWHVKYPPVRRPSEYRAPSWSWASVDSPVEYTRSQTPAEVTSKIELLEIDISYISAGLPFGRISSASLTVKGPVKQATWFYHRSGLRFMGSSTLLLPDRVWTFRDAFQQGWDEEYDSTQDVWCLNTIEEELDTYTGHVEGLILVSNEEGHFKRVGHFKFPRHMLPYDYEDYFDEAETQVITMV